MCADLGSFLCICSFTCLFVPSPARLFARLLFLVYLFGRVVLCCWFVCAVIRLFARLLVCACFFCGPCVACDVLNCALSGVRAVYSWCYLRLRSHVTWCVAHVVFMFVCAFVFVLVW